MDPKLRTLEIFRMFAITQNVTETARLMRISQPAVSQILRELEAQIGLTLFQRVGNRLQLTAEAQAILPDITRLIAQMGTLRNRVADLRDARAGHLSIASVPTMTNLIIPRAVANIRASTPDIRFRLTAMTAADVVRQVRLESADIGLTFLPVNENGVTLRPLVYTEMVCLLPRGHRLERETLIIPEMLREETVIVQGPETPPGFVLRDAFDQAGIDSLSILEVNQSGVALPLVAQGVGVALAHPLVLLPDNPKVVARRFAPKVELTLALVFPRYATPSRVTSTFVKELSAQCQVHASILTSLGLSISLPA